MPKKDNPLRQLPADMQNYGEIKLHLKEILEERKNNGIFRSYDDFYDRCKGRVVNSRVVKILEECGALEFNKNTYLKRVTKYNSALYSRSSN